MQFAIGTLFYIGAILIAPDSDSASSQSCTAYKTFGVDVHVICEQNGNLFHAISDGRTLGRKAGVITNVAGTVTGRYEWTFRRKFFRPQRAGSFLLSIKAEDPTALCLTNGFTGLNRNATAPGASYAGNIYYRAVRDNVSLGPKYGKPPFGTCGITSPCDLGSNVAKITAGAMYKSISGMPRSPTTAASFGLEIFAETISNAHIFSCTSANWHTSRELRSFLTGGDTAYEAAINALYSCTVSDTNDFEEQNALGRNQPHKIEKALTGSNFTYGIGSYIDTIESAQLRGRSFADGYTCANSKTRLSELVQETRGNLESDGMTSAVKIARLFSYDDPMMLSMTGDSPYWTTTGMDVSREFKRNAGYERLKYEMIMGIECSKLHTGLQIEYRQPIRTMDLAMGISIVNAIRESINRRVVGELTTAIQKTDTCNVPAQQMVTPQRLAEATTTTATVSNETTTRVTKVEYTDGKLYVNGVEVNLTEKSPADAILGNTVFKQVLSVMTGLELFAYYIMLVLYWRLERLRKKIRTGLLVLAAFLVTTLVFTTLVEAWL